MILPVSNFQSSSAFPRTVAVTGSTQFAPQANGIPSLYFGHCKDFYSQHLVSVLGQLIATIQYWIQHEADQQSGSQLIRQLKKDPKLLLFFSDIAHTSGAKTTKPESQNIGIETTKPVIANGLFLAI